MSLILSTLVFRDINTFQFLSLIYFLQNPENKLKVSEIYLEHYKTIMYDFMTDDQELDVSIANLRWGSCHFDRALNDKFSVEF